MARSPVARSPVKDIPTDIPTDIAVYSVAVYSDSKKGSLPTDIPTDIAVYSVAVYSDSKKAMRRRVNRSRKCNFVAVETLKGLNERL